MFDQICIRKKNCIQYQQTAQHLRQRAHRQQAAQQQAQHLRQRAVQRHNQQRIQRKLVLVPLQITTGTPLSTLLFFSTFLVYFGF